MEQTPQEEAEELVDGVVDNERSRITDKHDELIEKLAENLSNFREMNTVFSETRRRLENDR